jgi:hypothetical protein
MPTKQSLRPHQERIPAAARQHPAQRGKQQPVALRVPRLPDLPAKDRKLVPEHENLEILRPITAPKQNHELQQAANDDIQG